jgi:hypothetical protein
VGDDESERKSKSKHFEIKLLGFLAYALYPVKALQQAKRSAKTGPARENHVEFYFFFYFKLFSTAVLVHLLVVSTDKRRQHTEL